MYCEKCGNKINDESNFCDKCGNEIENKSELVDRNEIIKNKESHEEYNFTKLKQIGTITMFIANTKVILEENKVLIEQQKKYLGFIKGKKKMATISLGEISLITINKRIDLVDGIYAIVFALVGLVTLNLFCFIVMAVCLWTGYGERIIIQTKNNTKIRIHAESNNETQKFVDDVKNYSL